MSRYALLLVIVVQCLAGCAVAGYSHALPKVRAGFRLERIATIVGARELAISENGDLFAGTAGKDVYIVSNAQGAPAPARVFVSLPDSLATSVVLSGGYMYVGTQFGVWRSPYRPGDRALRSTPQKIAAVRPNGVTGAHVTTSVAVFKDRLYASVGSSCNACDPEIDATRATVQEMRTDGSRQSTKAVRIRNAIAMAINPVTGSLWAGVAGQDELSHGHPYEIFDSVTSHAGVADYGWPFCYENRRVAVAGKDCSRAVIPRVVFPAYETPIGATFYPVGLKGRRAFPREYAGGAFVTLHGSWHQPPVAPRIVFVPMRGDDPSRAVDWNNPDAQWSEFVGSFQSQSGTRTARPTGITVGPDGSLFFADDLSGGIYRIRPVK